MLSKNYLHFSATFTAIDEKQKEVSKMQRFRLISEYCDHSMFPPPLCANTYPYIIYKNLTKLRKCLPRLSTNCPKVKCHAQSTTDVEDGRNTEGSKTSQSSTKPSGKRYTTFTYIH